MDDNHRRILNMLAEGKLTADEAATLLSALESKEHEQVPHVEPTRDMVVKGAQGRKPSKLRVTVATEGMEDIKKANVNVSVPLGLVRTLMPILKNNIPVAAQREMEKQNVDLGAIINGIDEIVEKMGDMDEDIVNIDVDGGDDLKSAKVRVYFE